MENLGFWNQDVTFSILDQDEKQITFEIQHVSYPSSYLNTFVCVKCREFLRRPL